MITFTILLIAAIVLLIAFAIVFLTGSVGVIVAFGDLIICAAIIWLIVRLFRRRN